VIHRLGRFLAVSYPPALNVTVTVLWGLALTALVLAGDGRAAASWTPVTGLAVSVLTLFIDLLLLRALDDLRDLDYDRAHHPRRPLAAGVVRVNDLIVLVAVITVLLLAVNVGRGGALVVLALQLGYAIALVTAEARWRWPATENMLVQLVLNAPVQLLLSAYVYAAFLADRDLSVAVGGAAAVGATFLATMHWEFARKISREPAPTERTYVHQWGLPGTVLVAQTTAVLSVACAVVATRAPVPDSPAYGWGWLALTPLVVPAVAGHQFRRRRLAHWPAAATSGFVMASFLVFIVVGLVARVTV
jgi:hypothetical protein